MSPNMRAPRARAAAGVCASVLTLAIACQKAPPASSASPETPAANEKLPPPLPPEQVSAPVLTASANPAAARPGAQTPPEKRITVSTYGQESDVKPILQFIAQEGGFSLVLPIGLRAQVNVDLRDVPVSVALQTVLAAAGLSLVPTTGITAPRDTSVVFYQLPVNVDSLPVEAIMKRFHVSREIAEMIVRSRKP